ncbi:MAG TPA: diaminopimelate decarboxylase [Burkholderiales bacterium]|nr:diaminopimelate decarboxylase [Burkholderiales bacterium]
MTGLAPRSLPWPYEHVDGWLVCQGVRVADIAKEFGTPCYIYSEAAILKAYEVLACPDAKGRTARICYAVKANSNLAILRLLARAGAGFDIVSAGELQRVVAAGGRADRIVFSGVGKTVQELRFALEEGVGCINVESLAELQQLESVAAGLKVTAPISIRVNPDIDAKTHPYISTGLKENKFGLGLDDALEAYRRALKSRHLRIVGVDCHIGSQLTELAPFQDALERVLALVDRLAADGIRLQHVDAGGGLGVRYQNEQIPGIEDYVSALKAPLAQRGLALFLEPGRSIVANSGVLLMQVDALKVTETRHFALVDAAMNDMLRPALYQAWMDIQPLTRHSHISSASWDIVGPVCETGDFLAKGRDLSLLDGDYLALMGAGAYGFTMASNYNSRPRPAEILVDQADCHVVRERETIEQLYQLEKLL